MFQLSALDHADRPPRAVLGKSYENSTVSSEIPCSSFLHVYTYDKEVVCHGSTGTYASPSVVNSTLYTSTWHAHVSHTPS